MWLSHWLPMPVGSRARVRVRFVPAHDNGGDPMQIEFVASVAVITSKPSESRRLYLDALGLPLKQLDGEYFASEEIGGCKHFGVWPLEQAAEACFGTSSWPGDVAVPQMRLGVELAAAEAVARRSNEIRSRRFQLLHHLKR